MIIYELDEQVDLKDINNIFENLNNEIVSYGKTGDNLMINPYFYFGEKNIWPRGFRIRDFGKDISNYFFIVNSSNIGLKPLIYQGLINELPDIDSLFFITNKNYKNFQFSNNYPLVYLPGNYISINSKNTRYIYEVFPLLMFSISIEENIADIWRGYIMQYFIWKYKGFVVYHNSEASRHNLSYDKNNFVSEKNNFFKLNKLLNLLYNNLSLQNPLELIKYSIKKNILKEIDLKVYKAFLSDLKNIGYDFSSYFPEEKNMNFKDYIKISSESKLYLPPNQVFFKNDKIAIIAHRFSKKIYNDILLIVNYNKREFISLNKYMKQLYMKFFPNMVFIYPSSEYKDDNIISCNESFYGYYSYICFSNIVQKYPFFKGYLLINDDNYMKPWELENLDFEIPWLYLLEPMKQKWCKGWKSEKIYNILEEHLEWKERITKFFGSYTIHITNADFYYLPNSYAFKFSKIVKIMFNSKIFLECAVPNSLIILSCPMYQIIYYNFLWGDDRKYALYNLYRNYKEITLHPIKFSNLSFQNKVNDYIYFINAINY